METGQQENKKKEETGNPQEEKEKSERDEKDFWDEMMKKGREGGDKKNIYIQYRIVNNHGIMTGDSAQIEEICWNKTEGPGKKQKSVNRNIFSDEKKRNRWLAEHYETYPMALMIAAAAFDSMPFMWVIEAAETLCKSFKKGKSEEEQHYAVSEILGQFGAVVCKGELRTYTGITPVDIIRLESKKMQKEILRYLWMECPQIQDTIMLWLEKYQMGKKMSMSKRAGEVMGWLAGWDYYYFLNHMVPQIRRRNHIATDMMIAQIVTILDGKKEFQDNIYKLLKNWSKERNIHYLLTGLFVCAGQKNKEDILEAIISCYIERTMEELQREEVGEYLLWEADFFASGMRAFTFYRILIEKLYDLACDNGSPRNRRNVCRLFLGLFQEDMLLARYEKGEDAVFIRIARINDSTGNRLRYLWGLVWKERSNRDIFYYLLAEYDKKAGEMPGYNLEELVQKIFGNICEEKWQVDICSKIRRRSGNE